MGADEHQLRQQIVEVGRWIYQKGWVAANDGNISARLAEDRLLMTPTGVSKGMLSPEQLIVTDLHGNKIAGEGACTTELDMHLAIYRLRPDVNAVLHTHAPVSTGFAAAGRALDLALLPEAIIGLGCVPLAPYGLPGTPELAQSIEPLVGSFNALLLANHGVVTYAHTLRRAFFLMETVEHVAKITLVAELAGGPKALSRREVQRLLEARPRYGLDTTAPNLPGCPKAAEDLEFDSTPPVSRRQLLSLLEDLVRSQIH